MNTIRDLPTIKAELEKEVSKKKVNFARITELATELSKQDNESASFSVNASIIRRLGRELMASQETALAELVKNSFDADSTTVKVIFSGTEKAGGRLIIEDNGVGMTPEQVKDGFLRIASDLKEIARRSSRYERKRAGQKGIGRFAVERLGQKLTLITSTLEDPLATELTVEWSAFEKSADLLSIRHPIARVPKKTPEGTTLIIDKLREPWSMEAIQTAEAYVGDLSEPTYFSGHLPPSKKEEEKEEESDIPEDPGFKVEFSVLDGVKPKRIEQAELSVVNAALALIDATVDETGRWEINLKSNVLKLDRNFTIKDIAKEEQAKWRFTALRCIRLQAAYFVNDKELLEGIKSSKITKTLRSRGGIKIYRNGFRVPPYGNPDDDWLTLARLEARRAILVPLKNTNWMGFVSIDDPDNALVVETSNREGLVLNDFFSELSEFTRNALIFLAEEAGRLRNKKIYASDNDFGQAKSERALKAAKTVTKYIADLQNTRKSSQSSYTKDAVTDSTLADIKIELEKIVKDSNDLIGEVAILRVFASVGMSVLMFSHEVKGLLTSMLSQIDELLEEKGIPNKTRLYLKDLRSTLDRLQHLTGFYEATGSAASDRTLTGVDVYSLAFGFVESFKPQAEKRGIKMVFEGDDQLSIRTVSMHEAELSSVFINLYTNAVKAIHKKTNATRHEIRVRHSRVGNADVIEFMDTGSGIKAAEKDEVFKPFFTTTPVKRALRPGDPEMFGTGLGLTIVRDAIRSARGTIDVVFPAPKGFSTCFRIELPHIPNA